MHSEEIYSVFGIQFTASTVVVFIINTLEHWFPGLANVGPMVKRGIAWLLAAGTAFGIHETFNSSTGTLVVTGLTLTVFAHGLFHWIQSVALQEFVHRSTKKNKK